MSVHHSPKSGKLTSGSGSGSQPDLRTYFENMNTTAFKRKYPDYGLEWKADLKSFKTDIMSFFAEFANTQKLI